MFNKLPLFENAKQQITTLKPALKILGDKICEEGLQDAIGINLLHRHFKLNDNEILVKTVYEDHAIIKPSKKENNAIPYLFKIIENDYQAIEYISKDSIHYERVKECQNLLPKCQKIKETLTELRLEDELGVFIRHQSFEDKKNGLAWVEDSLDNRKLKISKQAMDNYAFQNTTETNWYFTVNKNSSKLESGIHCGVCCGIHCGWHGLITR